MKNIPADSIDYAVMEHSERIKMVSCDMQWSDLGSFDSLDHQLTSDRNDNVIVYSNNQAQDPITEGAKHNVVTTSNRQIAMIDVQNLLVVDTDDALLISHKGSSQKVKQVLKTVKENKPELAKVHSIAYRPWGSYQVLVDTKQYKVKRIVVKPGDKLSLQKHHHRSEHWVVVSGTATVTLDQDEFLLRPNESTYIKIGQVHRLENKGKINLVIIEVQVGEYTGEDDIVRVDDVYGR
jgi:mannose-1-phosphate guanylyltransferase